MIILHLIKNIGYVMNRGYEVWSPHDVMGHIGMWDLLHEPLLAWSSIDPEV